MPQLAFSVVVCTRNRSALLADAVTSLRQQDYSPDAYEIVVVDNASTDATRQEVERLQRLDGPSLRYVYESQLGVSYARNTGARQARGRIVTYMDDDAVATPGWLAGLEQGYKLAPDVVGVGGEIKVQWEGKLPPWLPQELEGYFGDTAVLGHSMRILDPGMYLFAGNLSVLRSCFSEIGGFSIHLGPGNKATGYSEEVEFCRRIWQRGKRLAYVPQALVYHRIFSERMTRRYVLRRMQMQGMSDVIVEQLMEPYPRWKLFLAAALSTVRLGRDLLRAFGIRATGRRLDAFAQLAYSASRWGRVQQDLWLAFSGLPADFGTDPPKLDTSKGFDDA